jgi:hypothetical protein
MGIFNFRIRAPKVEKKKTNILSVFGSLNHVKSRCGGVSLASEVEMTCG